MIIHRSESRDEDVCSYLTQNAAISRLPSSSTSWPWTDQKPVYTDSHTTVTEYNVIVSCMQTLEYTESLICIYPVHVVMVNIRTQMDSSCKVLQCSSQLENTHSTIVTRLSTIFSDNWFNKDCDHIYIMYLVVSLSSADICPHIRRVYLNPCRKLLDSSKKENVFIGLSFI